MNTKDVSKMLQSIASKIILWLCKTFKISVMYGMEISNNEIVTTHKKSIIVENKIFHNTIKIYI